MKSISFIVLLILLSVGVCAEEKVTSLNTIEQLNANLEKQRLELSKCPRVRNIQKLADLSKPEAEYYEYATNKIINEFNLNITKHENEKFVARLGLLVRKDGAVEAINVLTIEPIAQKSELEKIVKYGKLKLKELPVQEECTKYNMLFSIEFNGKNYLRK
jgi:hypothetical protein